eukprot:COSAG01_NODE_82_length_27810_cov_36.968352_25_plen_79_part_00
MLANRAEYSGVAKMMQNTVYYCAPWNPIMRGAAVVQQWQQHLQVTHGLSSGLPASAMPAAASSSVMLTTTPTAAATRS